MEKYYQFKKAELCCDVTSIGRITLEDYPAAIERISKNITTPEGLAPNFDEETLVGFMLTGLKAKFQNHNTKSFLLATGSKRLAECSNVRHNEIGSLLHDEKLKDSNKWDGKNKLGTLPTKVRNELKLWVIL